MSDNYNGFPYKMGFLQSFKQMPPAMMDTMVNDLGLKMPVSHLTAYRNLFKKTDYRYTIDELYMVDALYSQMTANDFKYSISSFYSKDDSIRKAFADLLEKRRVMCDTSPVTLEALVYDYNAYLCAQGYDDGAAGGYTVAPQSNTDSPATTMQYRTSGNFFTHGNAPYAIAKITKPSRFNTDKGRITAGKYGAAALSVMLIRLSDSPLMYEMLSDVVNAIPHLCNGITYLAPLADEGLLRRLTELDTGFTINLEQVGKLFPEFDRPHLLAQPMSAAVLIAPPLAAGGIITELRRVSFDCEIIGTSAAASHLIGVNFGGFTHTVDVNALRHVLFTRSLNVTCEEGEAVCSSETTDGISINVFDGFGFSDVHEALSSSVSLLQSRSEDNRLCAYVCLPFSVGNASRAFTAFLAVYRALAESAIPIRLLTTFNDPENGRLCVFITDENGVFGNSSK
jgi:hypothetical protein